MTPLEQLLPALYRTTPQDRELQRVLLDMVAKVAADQDTAIAQLFPSTADRRGLELWERAYGIHIQTGQSIQQRRARILAKVKGTGTTTVARVQGMAEAYWPDCLVEEITGEYLLRIVIVMRGDQVGYVPYLSDFWSAINELKPAHLAAELAWMSLSALVIRTAWGYTIYSARRCGTYPQVATRGGIARELVVVETAEGRAVYSAPMTGETVAGTHPQTATQGGQVGAVVIVEGLDGQVVYAAPTTGETVTGTYPQTATRGGAGEGGLTFTETAGSAGVYARPCGSPPGAL